MRQMSLVKLHTEIADGSVQMTSMPRPQIISFMVGDGVYEGLGEIEGLHDTVGEADTDAE